MMKNNIYDLVVIGGGTAGCACAYTAGKLGLKTLLVEKNSFLGGTITSSLVIPAMKTSENSINNDFFNTLYTELHKLGGALTYMDGNKGWFNPELTKIVLDKLLISASVDILFEASIEKAEEKLSSYIVTICNNNSGCFNNKLLSSIETKYLIDATGNADVCKMLNCDFLNSDLKSQTQPVNLRFILSGVNVEEFEAWLTEYDKNREVTSSCRSEGELLLSTAYTWDGNNWALEPLFKDAIENKIITEEDANYFQIFSVAGTHDAIAFNCPRIIKADISSSEAYIQGRESILHLLNFCKEYFPGFENAYISSIADSLGIRVSNRVKCRYVYTKDDILTGKTFSHPVLISNYPIDIHSKDKNSSVLEYVNKEYQLPIEALIINDNLFVIGRCISADFEAQAALRIIPSCFSMGEGLAKYLAGQN